MNVSVKLQSLAIAMLLNVNCIAAAIGVRNFFVVILGLIFLLVLISKAQVTIENIGYVLVPTLFCLVSFFAGNSVALRYSEYMIAVGSIVWLFKYSINVMFLLKSMLLINILTIPLFLIMAREFSLLIGTYEMESGSMMGLTYSLAPSLLACIAILFIKQNYTWKLLSIALLSLNCVIIALIGSRGIVGVIAVFLVLIIYFRLIKRKSVKRLFLFFIILFLVLISLYLEFFLDWIFELTDSIGINIYAIQKATKYLENETFNNGRYEVWTYVYEGFFQSPIGHFVGSFEETYETYQHNLFLQLIWEFGIVGFFIGLWIVSRLKKLIMSINYQSDYFLLIDCVICVSFVVLMYSGTFWTFPSFWLMLKLFKQTQKNIHSDELITL